MKIFVPIVKSSIVKLKYCVRVIFFSVFKTLVKKVQLSFEGLGRKAFLYRMIMVD